MLYLPKESHPWQSPQSSLLNVLPAVKWLTVLACYGAQPWREKISPLYTGLVVSNVKEDLAPFFVIAACCSGLQFFNKSCISACYLLAVLCTVLFFHGTYFSGWFRLLLSKLLSPTMVFLFRKWKKEILAVCSRQKKTFWVCSMQV